MKINYKKIATVLGSVLMVGSTMGLAAAANFPAPFSSGDVAIVTGSMGADTMDLTSATTIAGSISTSATLGALTSSATITGGDSFKLEKTSDKFHFNEALNSSFTTLDKDQLSVALADGTYDSGDIDEDYEQSITFGSNALSLFADNKYKSNTPTVGFWFTNNDKVLTYTMTLDSGINETDMAETRMPFLGNSYYVLSATDTKITLLDSADSIVLSDGESKAVGGKTVKIEYISDTAVKFNVNGEITDSMSVGDSKKLDDGSYIVLTDNMYASKETGVSKVEFSIGSGKIILENGKDVIMGEDSTDEIDNLVATVTGASGLITAVGLTWNSKDNTFLTADNAITMPGFGKVSLVYKGLSYAADSEEISLDSGEALTLSMGNYDIPIMWYNGTGYTQGEENYPLKIAASSYTYAAAGYANASVMFWTSGAKVNTTNLTTGALALVEDDRFIVTRVDSDLSDVETLYYEVSLIDVDGTNVDVKLDDLIGSDDLSFSGTTSNTVGDTDSHGDVTVTLKGFNLANTTAYLEFTTSSGTITYDKAVSEKGMVVTIPTVSAATTSGVATINFTEANKDEDLNLGTGFGVTVSNSTNDKLYVALGSSPTNVSKEETTTKDKYIGIVTSDLATKIATDESGDEYDFAMTYFGKEATADIEIAVGATVGSSTGSTAIQPILDTDTAAMAGKNLIVVGGSCVNKVAAQLLALGNPTSVSSCLAAFTTKTNVAAGQFVIQSFDAVAAGGTAGKVALLVAGYTKEDTQKASTYLVNKVPATTIGKKYIGTSTTEASLV